MILDEFINRYLVTLAVPMLLFDSNMSRVISFTGPLLRAFLLGSLATIVGTFIAFPIVPLKSLGIDQGWKVAAALAARHIGGTIFSCPTCILGFLLHHFPWLFHIAQELSISSL
jgi:uncharacterized membrane protein